MGTTGVSDEPVVEQGSILPPEVMKNKLKEGYNEIAESFYAKRRTDQAVLLLNRFESLVPNGTRVLDAGCGPGVPITDRLDSSYEVTGVDFSREQIRLARRHVPGAKFVTKDITKVDFPANTFDGICMYFTLFNIPREEHEILFEMYHEFLNKGGVLLLDVGYKDRYRKRRNNWLGMGADMFWSHYDVQTYKELLSEAGFRILDVTWADHQLAGDDRRKHPFVFAEKRTSEPSSRNETE